MITFPDGKCVEVFISISLIFSSKAKYSKNVCNHNGRG